MGGRDISGFRDFLLLYESLYHILGGYVDEIFFSAIAYRPDVELQLEIFNTAGIGIICAYGIDRSGNDKQSYNCLRWRTTARKSGSDNTYSTDYSSFWA